MLKGLVNKCEIRAPADAPRQPEEGRKLYPEAVGYGPDGRVHVEVSGLFLEVGIEHFTTALEQPTPYPPSMYRTDEYYP